MDGLKIAIGVVIAVGMVVLWHIEYCRSYHKKKEATAETVMQEIIEAKMWLYGILILLITERLGLVLAII